MHYATNCSKTDQSTVTAVDGPPSSTSSWASSTSAGSGSGAGTTVARRGVDTMAEAAGATGRP